MQIGKVTVDAVLDGEFVLDREVPYPGVDPRRWSRYESMLRGGREVVNQLGGYLVRTDDDIVLVDLGFGPTRVPTWESGKFLDSLAALGVKPEDVTEVLFTHLHFDHIGWAVVDGDPVFPHAVHRCHERDWAHFTSPDHADNPMMFGPAAGIETWPAEMLTSHRLGAIEHLMKRWDSDGEVVPGLEVLAFPGHTPGTTAIKVSSMGESAMLIGDIAHHQAELVDPEIHFIVDMVPEESAASQARLLEDLVDTGIPVAGAHFRDFEWGRVVRGGTGYAWSPIADEEATR
ncbi:MAG: beta-lactamase domain protein [Marmoricola sp.]|jgi:glyoxylase-like metal-dependent hydrolase (beta-lactamase superfamily II)|nr:beta-lactamase domain protein [Marmoricola sp.]